VLIVVLAAIVLCAPVARPMSPVFDAVAALVLMPLLAALATRVEPGTLKPVFTWLGLISYPLYVLQIPLLIVYQMIRHAPFHNPGNGQLAIYIAFLLVVATGVEYLFDMPLRKKLRAFMTR
jgi:peptidoglycan/LPS O-acetylase OafA/YrhL